MKIQIPKFLKYSNHEKKQLDEELEQFVAKRINDDDSNGKTLSH